MKALPVMILSMGLVAAILPGGTGLAANGPVDDDLAAWMAYIEHGLDGRAGLDDTVRVTSENGAETAVLRSYIESSFEGVPFPEPGAAPATLGDGNLPFVGLVAGTEVGFLVTCADTTNQDVRVPEGPVFGSTGWVQSELSTRGFGLALAMDPAGTGAYVEAAAYQATLDLVGDMAWTCSTVWFLGVPLFSNSVYALEGAISVAPVPLG